MSARRIWQEPVAQFVVLAYVVSWGSWFGGLLLYPPGLPLAQQGPRAVFSILGTFGPFLAASIVTWKHGLFGKFRARLFRWRVAPRWYVLALGLPLALVGVSYVSYRVLGGPPARIRQLPSFGQVGLLFILTLLVGGGNEEPGWRGFALPQLQARFGPILGTAVLAVVWAGWHIPAFLDPSSIQSSLPIVAWLLALLASTIILTRLYNSTESIPVVAVFHASFNVTAVLGLAVLPPSAVSRFYWTGATIYLLLAVGVMLGSRFTLGYSPNVDQSTYRP